jgi:hypothetical protein
VERYKEMQGSKGKPFTLQHCCKLLEHVDKWKLREQESTTEERGPCYNRMMLVMRRMEEGTRGS